VEVFILIECEIPLLKTIVELLLDMTKSEANLVHLENLDEERRDATTMNETRKKCVKSQCDKFVHLRIFSEGDLVLVYNKDNYSLGTGNFNLMWHGHYIVRRALYK